MHTSVHSYVKTKMECQYTSASVISQLLQISSFHLYFVHYFQPLLIWNFSKALQTRSFLRFLPFRESVSKIEAMVTILTEQLSLQMHLFGFVHAPEISPGMLASMCHALDISNLTWERKPNWFPNPFKEQPCRIQWWPSPKVFTLQLILQQFCSHSISQMKE